LQIESSLEQDHPDAEIRGCWYCLGWDGDLCLDGAETASAKQSEQVSVEYLAAAGWRISDGTTAILIDPYLSRILGPPPPLAPPYEPMP